MLTDQSLPESFSINGISIPTVGFGTFQTGTDGYQVKEVVLQALLHGYRHIDTATAYGNEKEVGEAIRESAIPRDELFITTKLAQTWHDPSGVEEALDQSLQALQVDYGEHFFNSREVHGQLTELKPQSRPLPDALCVSPQFVIPRR
ncbi:hypothetical protein FQN49_005209 [Arthroderma sp. PD_2]|nr:hypothetical protein FQN49_005209 [Arthroderma sp. PD_2]